jgi:putative protease
MKFAITVASQADLEKYLKETNTDIYIIGNEAYANRLPGSFELEDMKHAVELIQSHKKEVYVNLNLLIHDTDLQMVNEYLDFVKELDVDGVLFGDIAVYMYAKRKNLTHLLIYNPDTLNTNLYDPLFWNEKGIKGLTVAKEIIKDEVIEICKNSKIEVSIIGHGHLNMFHSRRPLIENFLLYNEEEYKEYINNRNLHLIEQTRDESYPVFQDVHGTHIFREKSLMYFNEIKEISKYLDVFIIDSIFKDFEYTIEVVNTYHKILNNEIIDPNEVTKQYLENHDSGFIYKKTVYDKY